jgi:hypothetical protein
MKKTEKTDLFGKVCIFTAIAVQSPCSFISFKGNKAKDVPNQPLYRNFIKKMKKARRYFNDDHIATQTLSEFIPFEGREPFASARKALKSHSRQLFDTLMPSLYLSKPPHNANLDGMRNGLFHL